MEKQKKEVNPNRLKCSNCGSLLIYIRIKKRQMVCRMCGNLENLDKEEVKSG